MGSPKGMGASGQAAVKLAQGKTGGRVAPQGGDGHRRAQYEAALAKGWMRHLQEAKSRAARPPAAALPQHDVEIEHPRAPAAGPTATEIAFDLLQHGQKLGWQQMCSQQNRAIGIAAPTRANRNALDDTRHRLHAKARHAHGLDGGGQYGAGGAVAVVPLV